MSTKICGKCNIEKEATDEHFYRGSKKYLEFYACKECVKAKTRSDYKNNPKYKADAMARAERYRAENQAYVQQYLTENPCVDCGETDLIVLAFDHRDPATKTKAVSILIRGYHPNKVKAEIAKCDVRCANCHIKRTAKQFGWWKIFLDNNK